MITKENEPETNTGGFPAGTGLRNPENKVATVGTETTGFISNHVDYTWAKYGIVTKIGAFDRNGLTPKMYKLVEIEPTEHVRNRMTIVKGLSFQVIPNEVALEVAATVAEKYGFKQDRVEYGKNGLSVYASFVSKDRPKEVKVGDLVAVGFQMKNSIDGSVGYGYNGYTLRLACTNGMTTRENENMIKLAKSVSIEEMVSNAESVMEPLLAQLEEQLETYRKWTQINVNMQLANILAVSLPKKYLPFIKFAPKNRAVVNVEPITVWDAFNRITDPLTHTRLEARHRDWFRARLNRAVQAWEEVESGRLTMDNAIQMVGSI
ncbi:MAG: DUF932 domain-containing protein [Candidatus Micrarchaeaceae archaeon]